MERNYCVISDSDDIAGEVGEGGFGGKANVMGVVRALLLWWLGGGTGVGGVGVGNGGG